MNHDSHGMGKHMLLMLICCLVPIGLIVAVGALGISLGPLQPFVPYVIALMCPLMMIFMMKGMMQGTNDDHSHHHGDRNHADRPQMQPKLSASKKEPSALKTASPAEANTTSGSGSCH